MRTRVVQEGTKQVVRYSGFVGHVRTIGLEKDPRHPKEEQDELFWENFKWRCHWERRGSLGGPLGHCVSMYHRNLFTY